MTPRHTAHQSGQPFVFAAAMPPRAEAPELFEKLIAAAATPDGRANVEYDRDVAQMVLLNWRSVANFFAWAAAHYGDESVDLPSVLRDEIETTRRFRELAIRPELGYGNMTWHPERCVAMSVPQASADLWRQVEINRCVAWKNQPCIEQVGDLWNWKIAHLEKQLADALKTAPGGDRPGATDEERSRRP